jgi:hypothetical protein
MAPKKPGNTFYNSVISIPSNSNISSPYNRISNFEETTIIHEFNLVNQKEIDYDTTDDICTPMECVKKMIDYIPENFWSKNIKVLDPCSGNGNFGAYCATKTLIDNIWFNEINPRRLNNSIALINPKNVSRIDALLIDKLDGIGWDLIVANPPYSGGGNKNKSLSNLFIEKSISLLKDNGYLCFITPNNWMTYNTKNSTLKSLLSEGSFLVIDNDAKKYFPGVGSSFTIFVWQKSIHTNKTRVINNYIIQDIQEDIEIPKDLNFIPLYISKEVLSIIEKVVYKERNNFYYRCDLHNFTQKSKLSDTKDNVFKYETIHTVRKTRFSNIKQDIYDSHLIIIPLSTYYVPYIRTEVNVTQSVGYIECNTLNEAKKMLTEINKPWFKLVVHLTRYGNFNNIMVLKHLRFESQFEFTRNELQTLKKLISRINY